MIMDSIIDRECFGVPTAESQPAPPPPPAQGGKFIQIILTKFM